MNVAQVTVVLLDDRSSSARAAELVTGIIDNGVAAGGGAAQPVHAIIGPSAGRTLEATREEP